MYALTIIIASMHLLASTAALPSTAAAGTDAGLSKVVDDHHRSSHHHGSHHDACCLLSPEPQFTYLAPCTKLSTYEGTDSFSCPGYGEVEYRFNAQDAANSAVRVTPNTKDSHDDDDKDDDDFYVHAWCREGREGGEWTPIVSCPSSVARLEPSTRPFLNHFTACRDPDFMVIKVKGHKHCPKV